MLRQRVMHKLTAYHWRHNRKGVTVIGYCSCGYRDRWVRSVRRKTLLRYIYKFCWLRGHDFGEPNEVHGGPVDFEESEDTLMWIYRQCQRCYKCVSLTNNRS